MAENIHLEEYKLVQGKIDKIGEFRFVVRGWAVTLTSAIVGATEIAKITPFANIVSIAALALFAAVEDRQTRIETALTARAFRLEAHFAIAAARDRLKGKGASESAPRIARQIGFAARPRGWHAVLDWLYKHYYACLAVLVAALIAARLLTSWDGLMTNASQKHRAVTPPTSTVAPRPPAPQVPTGVR